MGQEEQDMYRDYIAEQATGEKEYQAKGKYSPILRIEPDSRLASSVKIAFSQLVRNTEKAICVGVLDLEAGELLEEWFPKSVCSNLCLADSTLYCWDKFLKDAKPELYDALVEAKEKSNG